VSAEIRQDVADLIARARGDAILPGAACGPACEEALLRLEAYLDGELPDVEVTAVADHLTACFPCTDRASFEQALRTIIRRSCAEQAPPGLLERVRLRLEQA